MGRSEKDDKQQLVLTSYISPQCLRKVHNKIISDREGDLPAGPFLSPERTLHNDKLTGLGD